MEAMSGHKRSGLGAPFQPLASLTRFEPLGLFGKRTQAFKLDYAEHTTACGAEADAPSCHSRPRFRGCVFLGSVYSASSSGVCTAPLRGSFQD